MDAQTQPKRVETPAHVNARSTWGTYDSRVIAGIEQPTFRIGLAASVTIDGLVPMLGSALLADAMKPAVRVAEYNQIFQTCFHHEISFGEAPEAIILLWRIEEILGREFNSFILGDHSALDRARLRIDELVAAFAHLRQAFKGLIVVSLPSFPLGMSADLLDLDGPLNSGVFHRFVLSYFVERLRGAGNVRLVDVDALQRNLGAAASFDSRKWHLYKQPYSQAFLWELGNLLARIVRTCKIAPKKCVVLDCDNTLWGGIVGEEGIERIAIGDDFPGSAYRDLQDFMLYLRSKGALLGIASKNNERDVWDVFEQHDGMLLKREHISAWSINWDTKSKGLKAIAEQLNIGTDSLVFIDDNLFEIEQVRTSCPEVTAVLLDDEPARMVQAIRNLRLFDKFEVTEEDIKRADMLQSERKRATATEGLSKNEFIAALELKIELVRAPSSHLSRITQLINKTNQFNLTTIRRSLQEVEAMHADPRWNIYSLRVSDKFGDYGLVGVALVEKAGDRWRIDTFLMSCRVLGRNVEATFFSGLASEAKSEGAETIEAAFVSSAKNALVATLLPEHGFVQLDAQRWEIAVAHLAKTPDYVALSIVHPEQRRAETTIIDRRQSLSHDLSISEFAQAP